MKTNAQTAPTHDQREDTREAVRLSGKIFLPQSQATLDCILTNLSSGGAGLWCADPLPVGGALVLYVEGFGRFDGIATRSENGEMGLQFQCHDAKRHRLQEDLANFVAGGMKTVTRLRRAERGGAIAPIGHFRRAEGEAVPCEVLDISLKGASLKTRQRPPVGEVVHLGQTRGWVVRHSEQGIGVQFLQPI